MGFDTLLGNEQLKQNLTAARDRDRFSHFYLICGPEGSGRHTLADLLAAAMLCTGADAPCGVCPSCRKVLSHSHPDYVTVDDPEKATVPVELIRQARADVFVRPNEGRRKIYLFPRAQDMGIPGQNALLKVLEEPPEYGAFLLLTDNPNKLLPTVRSRCVELKLRPLPPQTLGRRLRQEFPDADDGSVDPSHWAQRRLSGPGKAPACRGADHRRDTGVLQGLREPGSAGAGGAADPHGKVEAGRIDPGIGAVAGTGGAGAAVPHRGRCRCRCREEAGSRRAADRN